MERPQNTERRKTDDTDRGTKILGFFMREAGIGAALLILASVAEPWINQALQRKMGSQDRGVMP